MPTSIFSRVKKTKRDDVVFKAEREQFERLRPLEAILDQHPWPAICAFSRQWFKHRADPFDINGQVHVAFLAASKAPVRGVMTDPVAPEFDSREYDERRQTHYRQQRCIRPR